jgi:hypothetical protein
MTMRTTSRCWAIGLVLAALIAASAPAFAQVTMYVVDDKVGVGTDTPDEKLHVKDGDLKVEQTGAGVAATLYFTTAAYDWEIKQNGATGRLNYSGTNGTPMKLDPQAQTNLLRIGVVAADTVDINGDLVISGDCTEQNGACADYVFEPDYELRPLAELEAFIVENKHLPNVPNAEEMRQNGVHMTQLSGRLLEKIEELTLYTLQQQELIENLQASLEELRAAKE